MCCHCDSLCIISIRRYDRCDMLRHSQCAGILFLLRISRKINFCIWNKHTCQTLSGESLAQSHEHNCRVCTCNPTLRVKVILLVWIHYASLTHHYNAIFRIVRYRPAIFHAPLSVFGIFKFNAFCFEILVNNYSKLFSGYFRRWRKRCF